MNTIFLYMKDGINKQDYKLVDNYALYEIKKVTSIKHPFTEWLDSYESHSSDETFIVVTRPYVIGESLNDFLENGLKCIEKGLKIVFKCRFNLSFHQMIDYNVFTTIEQQKAAFLSLYSIVMTDLFSHKSGRKRDKEEVKLLRKYWLAYVYKNARKFKGSLSSIEILNNLHISSVKLQELKIEIQDMLANGRQEELDSLVMSELYKDSSQGYVNTDSKNLAIFKEKLCQALSSSNTQLDLFTDETLENN